MILIGDLIFVISMLLTSVILLWLVTNFMVDSKRITRLLPFFFSGLLLCFGAALSLRGVFDQKIWFVLEFSWSILFLWIFIVLRRLTK
jgi:hypothetical protein